MQEKDSLKRSSPRDVKIPHLCTEIDRFIGVTRVRLEGPEWLTDKGRLSSKFAFILPALSQAELGTQSMSTADGSVLPSASPPIQSNSEIESVPGPPQERRRRRQESPCSQSRPASRLTEEALAEFESLERSGTLGRDNETGKPQKFRYVSTKIRQRGICLTEAISKFARHDFTCMSRSDSHANHHSDTNVVSESYGAQSRE